MARSPDCMLRLESLEWHAGTPVTTIGCAIQAGELPATGRPRRVRAADFEAWLIHQSMDGGKRHKRRGELEKWRQHYPDGEPAPFESYPVAAPPIEAEQATAEPELPLPPHQPEPDYRDMLLRAVAGMAGGETYDDLDPDVQDWWESVRIEGRIRYLRQRLLEAEADFAASKAPRHGALTEDEIARLEAA